VSVVEVGEGRSRGWTSLAANSRGELLVRGTRGKSNHVTHGGWSCGGLVQNRQWCRRCFPKTRQAMAQDCNLSQVWRHCSTRPCCAAERRVRTGPGYQMEILSYQISGRLIPSKAESGAERINLPAALGWT